MNKTINLLSVFAFLVAVQRSSGLIYHFNYYSQFVITLIILPF